MKKTVLTAVVGLLLSTSVFAGQAPKLEGYECGLQVGKSIAALAKTEARHDVENISEDISNYSAQNNLAVTLKRKSEKQQVLQAANNSWQSIVYSLARISEVSKKEAEAINNACDLQLGF